MSNTNTGGPAFPLHFEIQPTLDKEWCGMTLRDYFAAKAMQGIISTWNTGMPPAQLTSEGAYQYADAMLKARDQ